MKRAFVLGLAVLVIGAAAAFAGRTQSASAKPAAGSVVGTGSTFVFPLVSKWIPAVDNALGIKVTYSPTGSGAGIAQVTARTVDFGASDAPMTPTQAITCHSCWQIPWALSATGVGFTVVATIDTLIGAVNSFVSAGQIDASVGKSLLVKLNDAKQALARGSVTAARGKLSDFKSQVSAKSGQGIAPSAAQVLLGDADYVLGTLR